MGKNTHILSWPSSHPPPVPVLVSLVPDIFGLHTQGFLLLSPVWPAFCTQLCSLTSSRFEILDSGIRDAHFGILTLSLTNQVTVNLSWFLHLSGGSHLTTFQDCCRFRGDQRNSEIYLAGHLTRQELFKCQPLSPPLGLPRWR